MMHNIQKKIICFHLLNDYSGSPKVLDYVLRGLLIKGVKIDLYTSKGGILDSLDGLDGIRYFYNGYYFKTGFFQIIRFLWYQFYFFLASFKYIGKENHLFYINTLLPVGATLAAFLMRKKIIYHYHENAEIKGIFYRLLRRLMCICASKIICVSDYQASRLSSNKKIVIPNALPKGFENQCSENSNAKNILMISSLKKYKGVLEFFELSRICPQCKFELVLNAEQKEIVDFIETESITLNDNIRIYARQKDVKPFYQQASILLNLSNPNLFIETFGLTVIEAMAFGVPAIVPKVGGIAELIEDGVNGFKVDVLDIYEIKERILEIIVNNDVYYAFSDAARRASKRYVYDNMINNVYKVLEDEK